MADPIPPASPNSGAPNSGAAAPNVNTTDADIPKATAPRPVVNETGAGYPAVDTLSFEPEEGDWVSQTKRWVEQNPALALLGGAALGLVLGKLVAAAVPDRKPKTLSDRVERRAKMLSKESKRYAKKGRHYADDAGGAIAEQLAVAAAALGVAADSVGESAKHGYEEAKDFSEHLAETLGHAFSKKASEWLDKLS